MGGMKLVRAMFREMQKRRYELFASAGDYFEAMRASLDFADMALLAKPVFVKRGCSDAILPFLGHVCQDQNFVGRAHYSWYEARDIPVWPPVMMSHLKKNHDLLPYAAKSQQIGDELDAIHNKKGQVTAEQEARLLGYPLCCVNSYHNHLQRYLRAVGRAYEQASRQDNISIDSLIENKMEICWSSEMDSRFRLGEPEGLTSICLCDQCKGSADSVGQKIVRQRYGFAKTLMPTRMYQELCDLSYEKGENSREKFHWGMIARVVSLPPDDEDGPSHHSQ